MDLQTKTSPQSIQLQKSFQKALLKVETQVKKSELETQKAKNLSQKKIECEILTSKLETQKEEGKKIYFQEIKDAEFLVEMLQKEEKTLGEIFRIQRVNKSMKSIRVKKKRTYYWKIFELASLYLVIFSPSITIYFIANNFLMK